MSFRQITSFDLNDYIYDDDTDYGTISRESRIIKEIFEDLNKYTLDAQEPMDETLYTTELILDDVCRGSALLERASNASKRKRAIMLISLATLAGICIGGPLGGAGAAGITTAIAGTTTAGSIIGGAIVGSATGGGFMGFACSMLSRLKKNSC